MVEFILIIVLATTIWLTYDASTNKIPATKQPYSINNGALAWCLSALLLWIVTFPYYLVRRSQVLRERRGNGNSETFSAQDIESQLSALARLKEQKLISESDYEQKKKQLLGI
ncbi:MAG: SHOCT domain-containing protein [Proteobacteria bacterium]|nr:SHOCT domain-containing protein [Pseudomonadota bacterium]